MHIRIYQCDVAGGATLASDGRHACAAERLFRPDKSPSARATPGWMLFESTDDNADLLMLNAFDIEQSGAAPGGGTIRARGGYWSFVRGINTF